jgi:hypothetical protein
MSCDDHASGVSGIRRIELTTTDAEGLEMAIHLRVVDQLAKDGDGLLGSDLMGSTEGIAHAETHAVVASEEDVHNEDE